MTITWLDAALVLTLAVFVAAGAHKKLIGFFVGVGAALLLRPLSGLAASNVVLAVAVALLLGLVFGILGRHLGIRQNDHWGFKVLGGVGGLLLGAAMVGALITSLPIQRNPANAREIFYPPRNAPAALAATFQRSKLIAEGRAILLYPLLPRDGFSANQHRLYSGLHDWLVVGKPWLDVVE